MHGGGTAPTTAHALGEQVAHPSLVELALLRPWPGNVRELISQVKKAAANAKVQQSAAVRDFHLGAEAGMPTGQHPALVLPGGNRPSNETLPAGPGAKAPDLTREQVLAALEANGWNKAKARATTTRASSRTRASRPCAGTCSRCRAC